MTDRLTQQLEFIAEIDRLKHILRQTWLLDGSRRENDAEHSWHIAVMALMLAEHSEAPVDVARVVKMLLIHDVVEIDAGDTFIYDEAGHADKDEREQRAAERIFGLLPPDQAADLRAAWDEFEARQTPEARYAAAVDRLQPLMHNYRTQGKAWRAHGVTADKVVAMNQPRIAAVSPALWREAERMIAESVDKGYLLPAP
jgi:putative hydrolase of HD superfamily